jgi:hypothetical protein
MYSFANFLRNIYFFAKLRWKKCKKKSLRWISSFISIKKSQKKKLVLKKNSVHTARGRRRAAAPDSPPPTTIRVQVTVYFTSPREWDPAPAAKKPQESSCLLLGVKMLLHLWRQQNFVDKNHRERWHVCGCILFNYSRDIFSSCFCFGFIDRYPS